MEPWTLQSYTITLECPALPEIVGYGPGGKEIREQLLTVRSLKGREALGESFRYMILAQVENADFLRDPDDAAQVDLEHILHSNATIAIQGTGIGTPDPGMRGAQPRTNIGADIRYINGEITAASIKCVDDRAAVYEFVLEPFIWCAKMNRDRRIFKDQNVQEVISRVFRDYQGTIEWRIGGPWSGRLDYPKREYMRQEGECDWDFAMRLMEEWGLVCWFEHRKGFHSLVISDTMGGFHPHGIAYKTLRYHTGSRIDEEHISELEIVYASTVGKVTVGDHSYMHPRLNKNLVPNRETCESNSETALSEIEIYDRAEFTQASSHREPTPEELRDEGQHFARVKLEAERCKGVRARGKGHLRALQAGRTFGLIQFPQNKANGEYLVLSCDLEITEVGASSGTWRTYSVDTSFELMPAGEYYRMPQVTHKPRIDGFELAVIVAPQEHETWIDYRHCLLIQFEWDRDGDYEGGTSIWVRVVSQWQGDEMGTIAPGRAGQMVVVSHVNGDPDRPIVAGFVVDKFNRPPFQLPHNQALYGTRIKSLGHGREWAHSVLDATPGRIQAQIASDHGKSSLSLGYNTRIDGNKGLQDARGEGYELRTDLWGVLRAAKGMLLTTVARPVATGKARDMAETVAQLTRARAQHEDMAQLAQQHQAQSVDVNQHDATQTIKTQNDAIKGDAKSDDAPSPEMTRPDLLLSSSAGIATTTADSTHQASHKDHAITAGRDVSVSTGRSFLASVRGAVSMFAYQLGVRLIAAKGKVEIQAQSDAMAIAARDDINISSTDGKVVIAATKELMLAVGGSYIRITPSLIENGTSGQILERSASWDKPGPSVMYARLPALATHPIEFSCDADAGSAVSPPPPEAVASSGTPVRTADTPTAPPQPGIAPSGQPCSWKLGEIFDLSQPLDVESADYWAVTAAGAPYFVDGKPYFARYAEYKGVSDLAYQSQTKTICASLRLLIVPKQIREIASDGTSQIVPYDHNKDAFPDYFPNRRPEPRSAQSIAQFLAKAKEKIERDFSRNSYSLTVADCNRQGGCSCKIPVRFTVDFLTTDPDNKAHRTINLYPSAKRANAGNWGESVVIEEKGKPDLPMPYETEHVHTHECGHLFGFPDEYYWGGGAVHKQYITVEQKLNLSLAKNNPNSNTWQGTTPDTLMGGGVYYTKTTVIPPYYLVHIQKWFGQKTGRTWKVIKG